MANRSDDIREKLAYAQHRLHALQQELTSVQASAEKVAFVGQKVGEILATCRECFDYAAKDISELYLKKAPQTAYFPLSHKSLEKRPFSELSETHPPIYDYLLALAKKVEGNSIIENTLFKVGIVREVNELVNSKKHDKITVAQKRENAATHVQFPGGGQFTMSPIYRFEGDAPEFGDEVDAEPMIGSHPDIQIIYVSEYRLVENNWEISRYCNHAIEVTWRLLEDLYEATNMGVDLATFNPHESLKSAEQVAFEGFLKKAEHIVTQLKVVTFWHSDKRLGVFGFELEGNGKYKNQDDEYLANLLDEVFRVFVLPQHVHQPLGGYISENMEEIEAYGFNEKYWELTAPNSKESILKLPSGKDIMFDKIVWGLCTKFRQPMTESSGFQIVTSSNMARVGLVFLDFQYQLAIGTRPLTG